MLFRIVRAFTAIHAAFQGLAAGRLDCGNVDVYRPGSRHRQETSNANSVRVFTNRLWATVLLALQGLASRIAAPQPERDSRLQEKQWQAWALEFGNVTGSGKVYDNPGLTVYSAVIPGRDREHSINQVRHGFLGRVRPPLFLALSCR